MKTTKEKRQGSLLCGVLKFRLKTQLRDTHLCSGIVGVHWILIKKNEPLFPETSPPIQRCCFQRPGQNLLIVNNWTTSGKCSWNSAQLPNYHLTP